MTGARLQSTPALLIFDLDGTLVDSQAAIARSFNEALLAAGAPAVAPDQVYAVIGLPLAVMFTRCLPGTLADAVPSCVKQYRAHHDEVEIPRLQPFPGVRETLTACRAAGCTLSLATTKGQRVAEQVLDAVGLRSLFSLVLGGDSVPHHKPHPALVLRTLDDLRRGAGEALVIGDSSYDIGMAVGAGVAACGVTYGAQPASALLEAGATYLIDALPELLPLIRLSA